MNLAEAKEAFAKYEATHGERYHIFIAPEDMGKWPDELKQMIPDQLPTPEVLLDGRNDLDIVFIERSNSDQYFTTLLRFGAPEP